MSIRIYGNREIKTLPGSATRPTSSRVREALFNIWQGQIAGCRWLDLCAGSGAMGAEALCRGAEQVVGIEQSPSACQVIRQNWQKVATPAQSFQLLKGDVVRQLKRLQGQKFDRVYFDPPYASGLYLPVLQCLSRCELLADHAEIAIEYNPTHWQPVAPVGLAMVRQKRYGLSHLVFLTAD